MSEPQMNQELPTVDSRSNCCRFSTYWMAGLTVFALIAVAVAAFTVGRQSADSSQDDRLSQFPILNATASVTGDNFSMATGEVADEAEGLFVLDHNSGLLQCSVIYPRIGQFRARFQTNVSEALGTGAKGGQYMMVTGRAQFPRSSNRPAASTVVYVMDNATGNYACYGIPFNHTLVPRAAPQNGMLVLIDTGSANPVVDRDDLR